MNEHLHPVFRQIMNDTARLPPATCADTYSPRRAERPLHITIKDQYGVKVAHPKCAHAQLFAKLAGTKTLTAHSLALIEQLGYTINATME